MSKINGAVFGDTALDLVNLPSVTCTMKYMGGRRTRDLLNTAAIYEVAVVSHNKL